MVFIVRLERWLSNEDTCSLRGPEFLSLHPYGDSQPSTVLVPGNLTLHLISTGSYMQHAYTQAHTHKCTLPHTQDFCVVCVCINIRRFRFM